MATNLPSQLTRLPAFANASGIRFDQPLATPSTQTLVPYLTDTGRVAGFFPITETTFNGSETTLTVSPGHTVNLKVVTLPTTVPAIALTDNLKSQTRVTQFMAGYFPLSQDSEVVKPWASYPSLVPIDPIRMNMGAWWSMPVTTVMEHYSRGVYLDALNWNLDPIIVAGSSPTPPPATTPQALSWATAVDLSTLQGECAFFDFNWMALFQAASVQNPALFGSQAVALALSVVSNPASGEFKAVLVQNNGQSVLPGGAVMWDTVRILKLKDVAAGTYAFTFNISYQQFGAASTLTTPVTLNLTVR